MQLSLHRFHTLVFDFDGVFTNNKVYVDQNGLELVQCDRSDGYAIDLISKYSSLYNIDIHMFILSTESNKVVSQRASKLKLECHHGVSDKLGFLDNYLKIKHKDPQGLIYFGNDLNDLPVLSLECFFVAPKDAHALILDKASYVVDKPGGCSFVREFIEVLLGLDTMPHSDLINLIRS